MTWSTLYVKSGAYPYLILNKTFLHLACRLSGFACASFEADWRIRPHCGLQKDDQLVPVSGAHQPVWYWAAHSLIGLLSFPVSPVQLRFLV